VTDLEFDPFIDEIARELKQPVRLDARFDERVMAALEPAVIPIGERRTKAPWYRRTMSFPASLGGLAAAAALGAIAAIGVMATRDSGQSQVASSVVDTPLVPVSNSTSESGAVLRETQFIIVAPTARSVSVVGHFNDWDLAATPMVYDSLHGAWSVTVPLPPGRHEFQYVIDGKQRVNDPTLPQVSSDFGSPNSVITIYPKE
jgi:hypothetical protein